MMYNVFTENITTFATILLINNGQINNLSCLQTSI